MQPTSDLSIWDLPHTPPRRPMLFTQDLVESPEAGSSQSEAERDLVKSSLVDFYCRGKPVDFGLRELGGETGETAQAFESAQGSFNPPVLADSQEAAPPSVPKRAKRRRVSSIKPYLNEGFHYNAEGLQDIEVEGSTSRKRLQPSLPSCETHPKAQDSVQLTPNKTVDFKQYGDTDIRCCCVVSNTAFTTFRFKIPINRTLIYAISASEVVFGLVLDCDSKRLLTLKTSTESRVLRKHDTFQLSVHTSLELKNGKGKLAEVLLTRFTCS